MARPFNKVPVYKLHSSTGNARCWVGGRWVTLGKYGTDESRAAFARIVAELSAAPAASVVAKMATTATVGLTVDELILAYMPHVAEHYRRSDGTPTAQVGEFKVALRPLHELYGHAPAKDFGPLALKAVRGVFVTAGVSRGVVNARVGKIRRMFKWGVSEAARACEVYSALATLANLQAGRSQARETEPVEPIDDATVAATLTHLNRHVAGLVRFQQLTGCRPGEACALRRADIDTSAGEVWIYRPRQHKSKHRGKPRTVYIGKSAQALLAEFPTATPEDFVFSPALAAAEAREARAAARKTPRWPSHVARNEAKRIVAPKRQPGKRYRKESYLNAISRACDRAGVGRWHPNRVRHAFGTEVRRVYGLEAAQVLLGHARADVTQVYAEKNLSLALKVASAIG